MNCGRTVGVVFCVAILVSVTSAGAPGDEDSFCTNELPLSGTTPPTNLKILLDSYNYVNLLPPQDGAVWQAVDNDNNNGAGRGTEWTQNSNIPCRQAVTVCGFEVGPQDNWLITQYISTVVNDTRLAQVSVIVEYELVGCTSLECQRTFVVNAYETSTEDNSIAANTSNYRLVDRIATDDDTGQTRQNRTVDLNLNANADGIYLAIRDETTCIVITRMLVFYSACPGGAVDFVMRPETLAPIVMRNPIPLKVDAECVAGASPENGEGAILNCNQGGTWTVVPGAGCQCNTGFMAAANGRSCTGCPAGEYLSVANAECRVCPDNSEGTESGLTVCLCVDGYYRAEGEDDRECTRPPSEPTNVRVDSRTSDSITLVWDEPEDLGGRTDTFYILFYQEVGTDEVVMAKRVNGTTGTITGLRPGIEYMVFVSAHNGVSQMVMEVPMIPLGVSTLAIDIPIVVGAVVAAFAVILLVFIAIIIVYIMYRVYYSKQMQSRYDMNEHEAIPIPVSKHRTYVDPTTYASPDEAVEEFAKEIEPKTLRLDSEIGAGEFGTVFRGIWKEQPKKQVAVAIKTLKPGSSGRMRTDFLNEASIMGQFHHDHVIKLYGVVTRVDPAMIVMEFMDNGSLYSHLRANDEKLGNQRLLKMTRCVCSGMEYLATVGFVHRDLAARNVLVARDEVCKVADFGLSREVIDDEYNVQKGGKIPVRWTAPEAIYRRKFTSSSDVWSFGVLMWEVMTYAQHPYDEWDNQTVLDQLEGGYRLEIPHGCPDAVYEIMFDCWNKELSERPSFTAILKRLDLLLNTESPPKRPPKKLRSTVNSATNPLQCKSVEDWLESVKMERYVPLFQQNGINSVNQLVHLTEPDLREMGITLAGHLHRLTQSIESGYVELKRNSTFAT